MSGWLFHNVSGYIHAAEATGLGFVCFVVINPRVLSANRVDLGFFSFINFPISPPPPQIINVDILRNLPRELAIKVEGGGILWFRASLWSIKRRNFSINSR